jgi:hypothetical protein
MRNVMHVFPSKIQRIPAILTIPRMFALSSPAEGQKVPQAHSTSDPDEKE